MAWRRRQQRTILTLTVAILGTYLIVSWAWINFVSLPRHQGSPPAQQGTDGRRDDVTGTQRSAVATTTQRRPDPDLERAVRLVELDPPVNGHEFAYTVNNVGLCDDRPYLFVYIHTAPEHYAKRLLLRQTWARPQLYEPLVIRIAFFSGVRRKDSTLNQAVELEAMQFGDVIQIDLEDSYKNLTYKAQSAIHWISTYCNATRYVLKTDDDAFVNMRAVLRHLADIDSLSPSRLVLCRVWTNMHVMRSDPKWQVSVDEYAPDFYPPYCSGIAWLMSTDLILALHRVSHHVRFFWIDDVYLTGFLPERLSKAGANVTWASFGHAYIRMDKMETFASPCWYQYLFVHLAETHYFARMWKAMESASHLYPIPSQQTIVPGHNAVCNISYV